MTWNPRDPASARRWLITIGAWTVYGLANTTQVHLSWVLAGRSRPFWIAAVLQMPQAWLWALATPGIQWLGRRFPFTAERWRSSALIHFLISFGFVFAIDLGFAWHSSHVLPYTGTSPLPVRAAMTFLVWSLSDAMLYWAVLILTYAMEASRRFRERELSAAQLETQLVQADLHALKAQLHPHFLFNALHTIGSLVRTGDRANAVRVVAGLGDLLRRVLDGASHQEVPLRQELEFVRSYLEIEQVRFSDRLKVAINVDDSVLDARVPHLILQPLVENAIRHGIGPHIAAGHLTIVARRVGERLHLVVRDDGPGIGDAGGNGANPRPGIGLTNTRARLHRLYGDDYTLEVCNAVDGGLEARVELPLQLDPAGAAR